MQQVKFTRLYADEAGESQFEDREVELAPVDYAPPAASLNIAPFLPVAQSLWVGAPTDWRGDIPHPSPRRQVFCLLQGEYEVTTSNGTSRRFPVGSVLLLEDTWGKGHSTRITSEIDVIIFAVTLPDEATVD